MPDPRENLTRLHLLAFPDGNGHEGPRHERGQGRVPVRGGSHAAVEP